MALFAHCWVLEEIWLQRFGKGSGPIGESVSYVLRRFDKRTQGRTVWLFVYVRIYTHIYTYTYIHIYLIHIHREFVEMAY